MPDKDLGEFPGNGGNGGAPGAGAGPRENSSKKSLNNQSTLSYKVRVGGRDTPVPDTDDRTGDRRGLDPEPDASAPGQGCRVG